MKKVAILCKWMYTEVERPVMLDSYLVVSIDWIQRIISKDFFDNCRPLVFDDEKSKIIKKNQKNKYIRWIRSFILCQRYKWKYLKS